MASATKKRTARSAARKPATRVSKRPIVVATDGSEDADGALKLGVVLSGRLGAPLHALSVIEDIDIASELPMFPPIQLLQDPDMTIADRAKRVEQQCQRVVGSRVATTVRFGGVSRETAAYARDTGARLLITGRGRHSFAERLMGEEHLARLLRVAPCPVLASASSLLDAPKRVVVGVDFGGHDLATAQAAMSLMTSGARVYLVHVKPDVPFAVPTAGSWLTSYEQDLVTGLGSLRDKLGLAVGDTEVQTLTGHPGRTLVEFADRVQADLIAVGTHGAGFIHRLVIGSTTSYLLRTSPCSLLAVPALTSSGTN